MVLVNIFFAAWGVFSVYFIDWMSVVPSTRLGTYLFVPCEVQLILATLPSLSINIPN